MDYKIVIKRWVFDDEEVIYYETKEDLVGDNLFRFTYYTDDIRIFFMDREYPHNHPLITEEINRLNNERHRKRWADRPYKFREGPVPNIRKGWGRFTSSYRSPRTKQELSQEGPTRLARNNIPTSWDDVYRDTQRNWKKYRRTQWK